MKKPLYAGIHKLRNNKIIAVKYGEVYCTDEKEIIKLATQNYLVRFKVKNKLYGTNL